jgi:heme exporter protein C
LADVCGLGFIIGGSALGSGHCFTTGIKLSMNKLLLWFNQTGSPPRFDAFATRWAMLSFLIAIALLAIGIYGALYVVPADYKQGEVFRILFIHVPAAWMSLMIFVIMAVQSAIALIWRIKICELIAMASAPIGAMFTAITLITGAVWGKPTWGTWWTWDPRLTSELVLLFLYLGVMGLYNAIDDRRAAARAAGFLAIIGVVNVPIVHFAVTWWNTLHQGETIRLIGPSKMDSSMLWPLLLIVVATKLWYIGSVLVRARVLNLQQESQKQWAIERYGDAP